MRESNEAAIALYARSGFVEVGRRKRFYPDGEGAVLMNREPGFQPSPRVAFADERVGNAAAAMPS